jgi:haloalkane dehalogenase
MKNLLLNFWRTHLSLRARLVAAVFVVGMSSLSGCATAVDTRPLFEAHVAAFATATPHTTLRVPRADGQNIAVREFGAQFRGQGPSLVLMHGFPDNQHLYDLLVPALAAQHHVISFDFVGWGDSDKPWPFLYNVASQRADLEAVVRHFALTRVALVVHDLSGHAGIDWALDNPQSTAHLVLLNTYYQNMPTLKAPEAVDTYATAGWKRDLLTWATGKSPGQFKKGVGSQIGLFFSNAQVRDRFVPLLTHDAAAARPAFLSSTSVLYAEVDRRDKNVLRLRAFQPPVLIVFGADDPYLNVGVATEFSRVFPNNRLHLLKEAGHYVQLDQASTVAQLILGALN